MTNAQPINPYEMGLNIATASTAIRVLDVMSQIREGVPDYARERIDPEFEHLHDQVTAEADMLLVGLVRTQLVGFGTVALLDFGDRNTSLATDLTEFQDGTHAGRLPRYETRPYISRQLADTVCGLLRSNSYSAYRGADYIKTEARSARMLTFRDNLAIRSAKLGHMTRHERLTPKDVETLIAKNNK